jgi:uncharacterized Zn finger protein
MTEIPVLRAEDIAGLVGTRNLRHGRDYYHSGAILNPMQQGMSLKASCLGSSREPYQITLEFDERGVHRSHCTCPVGMHGRCKHVAALLICWQERPELFVDFEPWDQTLGQCSRRRLIETIKEILEYRPELQRMVSDSLHSEETPPVEIDVAGYRHRVAEVLRQPADTPESTAQLVGRLVEIKTIGDALAAEHEAGAAAAVYRAMVAELLARADLLQPQYPECLDVLHECLESLRTCFAQLEQEVQPRLEILRTLLELYRFELVQGGIALGIDVAAIFTRDVTADERAAVSTWIRGMLTGVDSHAARRSLGGLLLELGGDALPEEEFFDTCRHCERIFDLVRHLAQSGRMEQAVVESHAADDDELLAVSDLLVRYRHAQAAERLVRGRVERSPQPRLEQWLERHRQQQLQQQAVLELTEQVFRLRPTFAAYNQLRKLARQLGVWDTLHVDLLEELQRQGRLPLLVRIHLDEKNVDRALEAVAADRAPVSDVPLAARVARVAEASRPLESQRVYRAIAEQLIERRGRANYAEACRYLHKVRALAERTDGLAQWIAYLDQLQQKHRPLQGLWKELESLKVGDEGAAE